MSNLSKLLLLLLMSRTDPLHCKIADWLTHLYKLYDYGFGVFRFRFTKLSNLFCSYITRALRQFAKLSWNLNCWAAQPCWRDKSNKSSTMDSRMAGSMLKSRIWLSLNVNSAAGIHVGIGCHKFKIQNSFEDQKHGESHQSYHNFKV